MIAYSPFKWGHSLAHGIGVTLEPEARGLLRFPRTVWYPTSDQRLCKLVMSSANAGSAWMQGSRGQSAIWRVRHPGRNLPSPTTDWGKFEGVQNSSQEQSVLFRVATPIPNSFILRLAGLSRPCNSVNKPCSNGLHPAVQRRDGRILSGLECQRRETVDRAILEAKQVCKNYQREGSGRRS